MKKAVKKEAKEGAKKDATETKPRGKNRATFIIIAVLLAVAVVVPSYMYLTSLGQIPDTDGAGGDEVIRTAFNCSWYEGQTCTDIYFPVCAEVEVYSLGRFSNVNRTFVNPCQACASSDASADVQSYVMKPCDGPGISDYCRKNSYMEVFGCRDGNFKAIREDYGNGFREVLADGFYLDCPFSLPESQTPQCRLYMSLGYCYDQDLCLVNGSCVSDMDCSDTGGKCVNWTCSSPA